MYRSSRVYVFIVYTCVYVCKYVMEMWTSTRRGVLSEILRSEARVSSESKQRFEEQNSRVGRNAGSALARLAVGSTTALDVSLFCSFSDPAYQAAQTKRL